MIDRTLTTYLMLAGLTMVMVGAYIALAPNDYLAMMNSNQMLTTGYEALPHPAVSNDMLSDLRGMGGMLLFAGVFALASGFKRALRFSALVISTLVFSAYVTLRSVSLLLDGMPSNSILIAYCIELVFAFVGIALLLGAEMVSKEQIRFCGRLSEK